MNRKARRTNVASAFATVVIAGITAVGASGCSSSDEKRYDISPIFPLSANKCAEYNGEESGEGFNSSCLVTKSDCERAVEDWRQATGNVDDAIQFSCD